MTINGPLKTITLSVFIILFSFLCSNAEEIIQKKDKNGNIYFTNKSPAEKDISTKQEPIEVDTNTKKSIMYINPLEAINICRNYAKLNSTHPSTVDFSVFAAKFIKSPDGRTRIVTTFTAKNSFNLKLRFQIGCLFQGSEFLEATIVEAEN